MAPIALIASSLALVLLTVLRVDNMCSIKVGRYGKISLSEKMKKIQLYPTVTYNLSNKSRQILSETN